MTHLVAHVHLPLKLWQSDLETLSNTGSIGAQADMLSKQVAGAKIPKVCNAVSA